MFYTHVVFEFIHQFSVPEVINRIAVIMWRIVAMLCTVIFKGKFHFCIVHVQFQTPICHWIAEPIGSCFIKSYAKHVFNYVTHPFFSSMPGALLVVFVLSLLYKHCHFLHPLRTCTAE